jgi:LysR family transcriptional regulator, carnitine catabolism transcriptional activator
MYFLRLSKERSFRQAADSVHLSVSTFTKHIDSLEGALGIQLFLRDRRGVTLTAVGRQLVPYAELAVGKMIRLAEFADGLGAGSEGTLSIACYPVHIERFLGTVIERFRARNPGVRLDLTQMRDDRRRDLGRSLFDELRSREVDLAMGPPHVHLDGIDGFEAYVAKITALVPDTHPSRRASTISISELAHEPVLVAPGGYFSRLRLEAAAQSAKVSLSIGAQSSSPPALMVLGKSGLGVPVLPDDYPLVGQHDCPYPTVTDVDGQEIFTPVWLQWRTTDPLSPASETFIAVGKEVASEENRNGRIRQDYYHVDV